MGALGRSLVVAYTIAWLLFLLLILLTGRPNLSDAYCPA